MGEFRRRFLTIMITIVGGDFQKKMTVNREVYSKKDMILPEKKYTSDRFDLTK